MLPRPFFEPEHDEFRTQVRRFIAQRIVPFHLAWERQGCVPREIWQAAGAIGMLCCTVPQQWGGPEADYLYAVVALEEMAYAHAPGPGFAVHSEMVTPYVVNFASPEQKRRWLPRLVSGDAIAAVAMTEPGAGSDLRGIQARATRTSTGWRLSGQKVFISNGQLADVFVVAAKAGNDPSALSLFVVDAALPGVKRGKRLDKMGQHAQDTSEIFFEEVQLAEGDILGSEGDGMQFLMHGLARERLTICIICQARAEAAFSDTVKYVSDRHAFGQTIAQLQNTRFVLASVKADLVAGRSLVDRLIEMYRAGVLDQTTAAAGKLWVTEMLGRSADACLQLHGGWGYMTEYNISRVYADARVERIAGGTSEIMKEIIARGIWPQT
ncbi:acyl-CoA dehydrogenase [Paraburkholderia rhynchosiae]|uniref:Acyl-[acyl-carrier-protein] dehydrogenase MbtN n=1 Tax=Paraburkholderia rhynchosiae TaxID=487049 RepID=A0ABX4UWX4_9BURK|nr:acyl-CoA dehydrogenase [Paraburkholderia rhynchosiae]